MNAASHPRPLAALIATALLSMVLAAPPAVAKPQPRFAGGDIEILVNGRPAPHYYRAGQHHVLAQKGDRYTLRVWNRSSLRVEAVVSVDGRDVLDGQVADYRSKRGYVIPGHGYVDIDGWRLSGSEAAAFRFGASKDSYAARAGAPSDIGVVGVAFFPEGVMLRLPWPARVLRPRTIPWPDPLTPRAPGLPGLATSLDAAAPSGPSKPAAAKPVLGPPPPPAKPSAKTSVPPPSSAVRPAPTPTAVDRNVAGVGTDFGERITSPVQEVSFVRLDPLEPAEIIVLHYNDRAGLQAIGIDVDAAPAGAVAEGPVRRQPNPFPNTTRTYASPPPGWKR
jgi:hypothetical protein